MDHLTFITPIYTGFFGIMFVFLSWRIRKLREKHGANHGQSTNAAHSELSAAVRAQGNFVEHMPLALLLMWMLETMQFSTWIIQSLGILLIIARLMHLHGLNEPSGNGPGRKIGTNLTWLHIIIASLLSFAGSFGVVV